MIPMYEPLGISICEKCCKIIAEPKELQEGRKTHEVLKLFCASSNLTFGFGGGKKPSFQEFL